ncbi:DUF2730 family protein [Vibrio cholerae]|nr:DUF2730 family protein [Vibrio cholerae]
MVEWLKEYWFLIWAFWLTATQLIVLLLAKTFVRKEAMEEMKERMTTLESKVEHMPTDEDITQLRLELADARGELKELRAMLQPVNHLSQLLLEQRLKDDK